MQIVRDDHIAITIVDCRCSEEIEAAISSNALRSCLKDQKG